VAAIKDCDFRVRIMHCVETCSREMEMLCLILNYFYCLTIFIHIVIVISILYDMKPWENKLVLMSLLT
jgi:hypothetical protein